MININFFTYLIAYLFISFSVLGYGLFLERFFKKKEFGQDLGFAGLLGIFFLVLYSYLSHYFIKHGITHNLILLLIGFILFLILFKKKLSNINLQIFSFLIIISFISLLIYKTHDDFHYYHFPYSYYLTQHPTLIGIGQFNHGFRTHSSIFYLNSLFFLPIIKYFTFYISAVLILVFSNLILLTKIIEDFKIKKVNYISYLCLLFFIFINIFFYRIQEHGTDRSAQILIFILLIYLLLFVKFETGFEKNIDRILVIMGLIISLKAFYLLYLTLSIPVIYILYKEKKSFLITEIFSNKFFWLFILLLFNVLLVNFINTGCLIYPAKLTCFENYSWALSLAEVDKMSIHYENWSKGGHTPISKVENPLQHISYFNWLPNWIEIYFFTKVSDLILGLIFVMVIVTIFFRKKKNSTCHKNKNDHLIIIMIFLYLVEWFYNHPSLRYGGYCLIVILFFYPFSNFLEKYNNSIQEKKNKFISLICIVIVIFIGRNILRINDEIQKYSYKPLLNTYYKVEKIHFRLDDKFKELIQNFEKCQKKNSACNFELDPKMKKFLKDRYIFLVNK